MNLTLYSLFASYYSTSPMLMFSSSNDRTSTLKFDQLYTRNFFSTFLYTHTNTIAATISRSNFINYMQTALVFRSVVFPDLNHCQYSTNEIKDQQYNECQFVYNGGDSATIVIENCNFEKCSAKIRGGSIFFQNDGSLTVHGTFFKKSSASDGGAIFAAKKEGTSSTELSHEDAKIFHSHYCCYSSCSATGYGSAALVAASNIQLNYSSTLNCPDRELDNNKFTATGAQFDLKASINSPFIASTSINSTTGKSQFCASLEYRNANSGFFKYQTIVDQEGGFITSFTDLENDVEISNCNIINVTIHGGLDKNAPPGVVHVRHHGVTISNFFFYGIDFTKDVPNTARLITIQNGEQGKYTVLLKNSVVEIEQKYITNGNFNTENINIVDPSSNAEVVTQAITQLFLGDCQGEVKKSPPPIDYVEPDPTSEITSEPTSEITSEPTSEIIITSEPTIEPTSINETEPLIPEDPPRQRSGGSNKTPIIAGSVAAVAAVAIIAALVAFFVIRRRRLNFDNDVDFNETQDSSITTDNELRRMMSKDDPFDDEFNNQVQTDL